jgi:hypothetical protein
VDNSLGSLPTIHDALLVGGGDCQYLSYWMRQSGLADLLPGLLQKTVYPGCRRYAGRHF